MDNKQKELYRKEHYDRINLIINKEDKPLIQQSAANLGYTSVNKFILDAIQEKISRI